VLGALTMKRRLPPGTTRRRSARALTLLEVMIVIAVIGVLIVLVAPSMREMIGMQRLRGTAAQLVTDMQFARSEAVSRNQFVAVGTRNNAAEAMTCYVVYTSKTNPLALFALDPAGCDCTAVPGSACNANQREVRTVQIPRNIELELRKPQLQPRTFAFNPISGGINAVLASSAEIGDRDFCLEVTRRPRGRLRITVNVAGQASVCSPDLSVPGYDPCPAPDDALKNCPGIPAP